MRYPQTNDPDVLRFHRMRSALGAAVAIFFVAGLGAVMVTSPPRAAQVSVNCIATETAQVMSDALPGVAGCAPQAQDVPAQVPSSRHQPAPSASATTDDPPIPTF